MRFHWEQQSDDDPSGFLAMTSVLRLHQLMTTSVDQRLRTEFAISLGTQRHRLTDRVTLR